MSQTWASGKKVTRETYWITVSAITRVPRWTRQLEVKFNSKLRAIQKRASYHHWQAVVLTGQKIDNLNIFALKKIKGYAVSGQKKTKKPSANAAML